VTKAPIGNTSGPFDVDPRADDRHNISTSAHRIVKPSISVSAFVLILVALLGGLCLAMPFFGDQALFTVYARQLTQGAVLYRDVFDVKQPGLFIFYALGGLLFGFTEVGIHLFELIYWLAFSAFALVALRPYFTTRWGALLVPLFTVGVYYLYAGLLDLTQIEILVAFPIFVAWWLIDQEGPETGSGLRRYAGAGLLAAAVVLLKHLYILIILAFLGYAVLRSRRRGIPIADLRGSLAAFLIALLVPLLIVAAYFAAFGQLERIWWAYFQNSAAGQWRGRLLSYFVVGARRFMIGHGPILILAALGAVHALRERARPQMEMVVAMLLWVAVGAVAFFIQGWGAYKWLLFTVPLGVLAVVGFEALIAAPGNVGIRQRGMVWAAGTVLAILSFVIGAPVPERQTLLLLSVVIGVCAGITSEMLAPRVRVSRPMLQILLAALAMSVGLAAIVPADKIRVLLEHDLALTAETRARFRESWNVAYRNADEDLELLRKSGHVLPGPIYVLGDPVLFLRANRPQAVPMLGWGPENYDSRSWRELHHDLRATLPAYIIVDGTIELWIRSQYPALMEFIESRYKVAFVGHSGTWYVLR
jgi:hypothetical protein